ncbi:hypothetical protein [Xylocopilactobacillus apicola]|uniref:DUF1795 domain-containing protein n=1 Tax=Xylocopilactobacillus apicola TaxID=2932184 RepID=A0AAU9D770_9LACO|nr:hypothetical protein [Xylocopilactobacillus apicola]BDR58226.1 hypothetical protein XA3_06670 [Xylocopilactobacillus apicola]
MTHFLLLVASLLNSFTPSQPIPKAPPAAMTREQKGNNTEFEVGKSSFSIHIPDFNVMPEGDITDKNGNTWLTLESEKYSQLTIQLSLHNKASKIMPKSHSLKELGLKTTSTKEVNYHDFKQEKIQFLARSRGIIYSFETEQISAQLIFYSDQNLKDQDKDFYIALIKSIEVK